MKYFSPAILDGSVTTVKLADRAVTRVKVAQVLASQSGSILSQSKVTVALSIWALFPDIESDMAASATLDTQVLAVFKAVPAANPDLPEFDLRNEDTGFARDYEVDWRSIGP